MKKEFFFLNTMIYRFAGVFLMCTVINESNATTPFKGTFLDIVMLKPKQTIKIATDAHEIEIDDETIDIDAENGNVKISPFGLSTRISVTLPINNSFLIGICGNCDFVPIKTHELCDDLNLKFGRSLLSYGCGVTFSALTSPKNLVTFAGILAIDSLKVKSYRENSDIEDFRISSAHFGVEVSTTIAISKKHFIKIGVQKFFTQSSKNALVSVRQSTLSAYVGISLKLN